MSCIITINVFHWLIWFHLSPAILSQRLYADYNTQHFIVQVSHVFKLYLLYLLTSCLFTHPTATQALSLYSPHKTSSTNLILILDDCQSFNSKFFHDWILAYQTQKETLQDNDSSKVKYTGIAVHNETLSHRYRNSHAIWVRSVICHLAEVTFPPLLPAEAGTRCRDYGGMQRWADLGTAVKVHSPCPRRHITVAFEINTADPREIWTLILSDCSRAH